MKAVRSTDEVKPQKSPIDIFPQLGRDSKQYAAPVPEQEIQAWTWAETQQKCSQNRTAR
jgi:hypothetical protein